MAYGLNEQGFSRKRLDEILEEKNQATRGVFGNDINLAPQSPDGQMNGLAALSDDQLWQIAEYSYNATDPDKATGPAQSSLVKLNYITRQPALATTVTLAATGTPGVTIQPGQLVGVAGGSVKVRTRTAFTFAGSGNATVVADVTETGPIEIEAGLLTVIETPVAGWNTVTNPLKALTGRNRETDAELRLRRERSKGANSQNMLDSLIGLVGDVPGVGFLNVLENRRDPVDPETGLPGHSFEVIVDGGDPTAIAQAIWRAFPFGIGDEGNTMAYATDRQGHLQPIQFTRPIDEPVYVIATIRKRAGYPSDGDDLLKQAIVDYANGDLVQGRGFGTGDDVIYSELYTPLNWVPFHDIVDLFIGLAPDPTERDNIPIGLRETSQFNVQNITILDAAEEP